MNKNIFDLDSKNNCFGLHSNIILKTHYQENIYLLLIAAYGLDILDKKEPFENFGIFDNNKKEFYSCGSLNNSDFKNSQYYKGTIENELNSIYKTIANELEKYIKTNKKELMENAEFLFEYDKKYSKENKNIPDILIVTWQVAQVGINLPTYNHVINYHIPSVPGYPVLHFPFLFYILPSHQASHLLRILPVHGK